MYNLFWEWSDEILAFLFIFIILFLLFRRDQKFEEAFKQNEGQACFQFYGDYQTKGVPVKCLKYFGR